MITLHWSDLIMDFELKNKQDVKDFVVGCTFYGTGGGGSLESGVKILNDLLESDLKIKISDPSHIGDDDWVACAFYSGTIAPPTPEIEREKNRFPLSYFGKELMRGLELLEEFMDIKFKAVAPFELGGGNTPAPIDAAIRYGIFCIDGDYAGRAVPEICQNTVCLLGKSMAPMALVDWYGNSTIVSEVINYEMGEKISKALSEVAWGRLGNVAFPITGKEFHETIIPDTLSMALKVGTIIRECKNTDEDPAAAIAEKMKGWILFKGVVAEKTWENKLGYMWGETIIKGENEYEGKVLKIWFKNENHITWLDEQPWITSPDLIEVIDAKTGMPITNTEIKKRDSVAVIGLAAADILRCKNGLDALGPSHFGFDIKYTPIEELMEK